MSCNEVRAGLCWYAINTKLKQEDRAENNLRAWRVETFVPRIKERRRGRIAGTATHSIKLLFPRYIFARFDANAMLHKVRFTRGVQSVVNFGGVLVPVDDEVLAIMQTRAGGDGFIKIGEELKPGDRVIIKAGVFENFIGVFERELADADRVRILLTTINHRSNLTIDRTLVKKLGQNSLSV
jgi:transcription elongation factor/antiterminator RfaH